MGIPRAPEPGPLPAQAARAARRANVCPPPSSRARSAAAAWASAGNSSATASAAPTASRWSTPRPKWRTRPRLRTAPARTRRLRLPRRRRRWNKRPPSRPSSRLPTAHAGRIEPHDGSTPTFSKGKESSESILGDPEESEDEVFASASPAVRPLAAHVPAFAPPAPRTPAPQPTVNLRGSGESGRTPCAGPGRSADVRYRVPRRRVAAAAAVVLVGPAAAGGRARPGLRRRFRRSSRRPT